MDYINLILIVFGFSIGLFGYSFNKIKKLEKEINSLGNLIDFFERELQSRDRFVNIRIDGEIDRVNRITTNDAKFAISERDKLTQSILELRNEFSDKLTSGVEVRNALDKINKVESDLEDFVKMYRNQ